jgi:flavin-dependent dehydrogenase
VFPKAENFSIGAGGPKSIAKQLSTYCAATVSYYANEIGNSCPYITAGHHLPIRTRDEKIVFGRTLLVGDAAGLIEPLVGEGIYYAMHSAKLAAETIVEAIRSGDNHLPNYQLKVDQQIQPEIQISKSLLLLLDLAPRFWVPRLLEQTNPFWRFFFRIFTGEKSYQDFPSMFGPFAKLFEILSNVVD